MKKINKVFISKLLPIDVKIVTLAFSVSETLGLAALDNSISEFRKLLVRDVGPFINGMNIEYRSYVIGLLSSIDDRHKDSAVMHILSPKGK